ncbi:MAG: hypothetical protein ACRDNG_04485, partial [Gaiellaceae bacterium]
RLRQGLRPETGAGYDERAERAVATLRRMQLRGPRFEREVADLMDRLARTDATQFEIGLETLGALLGFEAERPAGRAHPDGAWREGTALWIVFEAKTGEGPEKPVSPKAVRQALTHADWVRANLDWPDPARTQVVLVTPRRKVSPDAAGIARDLCLVPPQAIKELAESVVTAHRDVRGRAPGQTDDQLAEMMARGFVQQELTTEKIVERFGQRRVAAG